MKSGSGAGKYDLQKVPANLQRARCITCMSTTISCSCQYAAMQITSLNRGFRSHDRLVINTARLVLLFALCTVIMITALLTWKVSLDAMHESLDFMSTQLRMDVTQGAMAKLKELMAHVADASATVYRSLDGLGLRFTRENVTRVILPVLWGTFSTNLDVPSMHMISADGLFLAYRRDGPEVHLLGNRQMVAVPAPANDTLALAYGYVPDENGLPLLNGSMVKLCATGSCPPVLDPKVYIPPTVPPLSSVAWTLGKNTRRGGVNIYMAMSPSALEPALFAASSFKGELGEQVAVLAVAALSRRLQAYIQATSAVQVFGGRICIAEGPRLNILSASNGSMFAPPAVAGQRPTLLSAVNSTDEVTREAARFLNETYGGELFTRPIETEAHLGSEGSHYVHSMPLVFEGLQLVVMLAPVRFRSDSFADRVFRVFRGLALNAKVFTFAECLIRICISTIFVSRTLRAQEKGLGEAAEANKELREQLQSLTELHDWPDVDMGTPLEKLTMIIKSLKPGCALSPEQVHQMQVLITADDLHKPQFLSDIRSADADAKRDLADSETGKWISLIATGRRTTDHTSTSAMTSSQTSPSSEGSASSSSGRNVDSSKPGRASLRLDASLHKLAHAAAASPIHEEFAVHMHPTPDAGQNRHATGVPTSEHRLPCQHAVHPQGLPVKPIGITSGAGTRFFTLRRCSRGTTERCELKTLMLTAQCAVPKVWEVPGGNEPQVENGLRRSLSFDSGTNNTSEALAVSPRAQSLDQMSTAPTLCKCPTSFTEQQRRQVGPLSQLGSWNFDVLELDAAAGEMTIPLVGYSLFFRSGFILEFDINEQKLANFLSEISRGMNNNPYHNAAHIADVSASVFHLLTYSGVGDHLRSIDKLAIVCAALIHDYKHPGMCRCPRRFGLGRWKVGGHERSFSGHVVVDMCAYNNPSHQWVHHAREQLSAESWKGTH
eukprot:jgi/Mesvir1/27073/Mv20765-RA.2